MTTAKLRLPNQNKFVEQFILDDHEPMTPAPGSTAGTIYTDFDPAAVERLRAAASQPARPYQRRRPARPKPAETKTELKDAPEAAPLVTLKSFNGKTNHEKGAFIRRHFPDWLAYQKKHELTIEDMLGRLGLPNSVWYNHQIQYRKHPERYGEQKPKPITTADTAISSDAAPPPPPITMADCEGQTQHAKTLFLRQHLASWVAYGREHKLTGPQMALLVGLSYPAWAKNAKRMLEEPQLYNITTPTAVEEPPSNTATSNEDTDTDQPAPPTEPRPWGNTFPEWEQYRRKNMLSTQAMADNVGIDRAAYLNQLKDYRAKTAKTNQPPATPATSGDVAERKPRPSDNLFEFNCPVTARIAVWNRWHPPHSRVAIITAGGIEHGHTITPATMTSAHTAVVTVMFDKMLLGKQEVDLTHLIPLGIYTNNSPVTGRQYAACPHCRNWNVETVGHATTCPDCGKPL